MNSPLISVVLPVYNGADYIRDAIESALSQTRPPSELVIVNDASTDGTADVIRLFESHPLVRTHTLSERVIAPVTWNAAIRRSTGQYFVILAHDDRLKPRFLESAAKVLEREPDVGLLVTGYTVIDSKGAVLEDRPVKSGRLLGRTTFEDLFDEFVNGSGMYFCDTGSVIARSSFDQIGGFDEAFRGGVYDYDFYLRLAAATRVYGLAEPLADYRVHSSNMSADLHRDDKGDADHLFGKLTQLAGMSDRQLRELARNIARFEFNRYTRAVRAPSATVDDMVRAREAVRQRLLGWSRSASPYSKEIHLAPPRIRTRLAWEAGRFRVGLALMHAAVRAFARQRGTWQ